MSLKDRISKMNRQLQEIELIKRRLAEKMDLANNHVDGSQQNLYGAVGSYVFDTDALIQQTRQRVASISAQAERDLQLSNQQTERQLQFMGTIHQMEMAAIEAHRSVRMGVPVYHNPEVIEGEFEDA